MVPTKSKIANRLFTWIAFIGAFGLPCNQSAGRDPGSVNDKVDEVLSRFRAARPEEKDLAIHRLDWVPNLQEAKAKALREKSPILLVIVTNSYGNMLSGHC